MYTKKMSYSTLENANKQDSNKITRLRNQAENTHFPRKTCGVEEKYGGIALDS